MAADQPTPEEKLFAVIQGAPHKLLRRPGRPALAGAAGSWRASLAAVDLPRVNQALTVVLVLMGLACAASPLLLRPRIEQVLARAQREVAPFVIAPPLEGLRAADEYLQTIRTQDPFRVGDALPAPPPPPAPALEAPPPAPAGQEQLADLRLVGIARTGAEPRAMVEQVSQGTTHVLKAGDTIGIYTIKDILEDRVVLEAGGQELELF
jgi:Tfp pilus assembly protein PilP